MTEIYLHIVARMSTDTQLFAERAFAIRTRVPLARASETPTGACPYNRPCAQQYVGQSQSCMVISGRLIVHAPVATDIPCAHVNVAISTSLRSDGWSVPMLHSESLVAGQPNIDPVLAMMRAKKKQGKTRALASGGVNGSSSPVAAAPAAASETATPHQDAKAALELRAQARRKRRTAAAASGATTTVAPTPSRPTTKQQQEENQVEKECSEATEDMPPTKVADSGVVGDQIDDVVEDDIIEGGSFIFQPGGDSTLETAAMAEKEQAMLEKQRKTNELLRQQITEMEASAPAASNSGAV